MIDRIEEIKNYRKLVLSANKESIKKEHFKNLLVRLFDHHEETKRIVDVITSGAEKPIFNIPRKDRLHRGSADTLYNKVIIEFENNLKVSLKHAKEQLAGYLLGEYKSGSGSDYVLIASDLITWRVFSIAQESLERLDELREDEVILEEIESSAFELKDGKEEEFYFWIDRALFKEGKQKARLKNIEAAFGHQSIVFRKAYLEMQNFFEKVKDTGEIQVSYEQWKKSLSIAYDNFNDTTNNFLIHTYLSVFAKMLAYQVLTNDEYIDESEIQSIIKRHLTDEMQAIDELVENIIG